MHRRRILVVVPSGETGKQVFKKIMEREKLFCSCYDTLLFSLRMEARVGQ